MRKVFENPKFEDSFSKTGYITQSLLDEAEIRNLLQLFEQHSHQYQTSFHTSHFSTDKNYKTDVDHLIKQVVFPKAESLFANYHPIFGNLMVKKPDSNYFMPLHSDWTYVDEHQCRSVAIWIPLVDTAEHNGCIGVIEGSHKVVNKIRGPRIQQSSYENDNAWVKNFGKLLPLRAGEALIYDHALLHYSPPNKSSHARPALNLSLVPSGSEILHYCVPEGASAIEVYRVADDSFYINYDNYQRPETNSLIDKLPINAVDWIDHRMEKFRQKTDVFNRILRALSI